MNSFCSTTVAFGLACLAAHTQAAAEKARIDPAGIKGALVLAGDQISADAIDSFHQLGGAEQARLVVLQIAKGDLAKQATAQVTSHLIEKDWKSLQIHQIAKGGKVENDVLSAVRSATGVWLAGEDESGYRKAFCVDSISNAIRSLMDRGGVFGTSGSGTAVATTRSFTSEGIDGDVVSAGPNLLPGAIVATRCKNADTPAQMPAALEGRPGLFGCEIDAVAALVVEGRRLRAVGDGGVLVHLAASETRPARQIELDDPGDAADLTALRKSAIGRAGPPFPPAKPPPPRVENGTLIIIGGGGLPAGIVRRFVDLAGGEKASIVVLPTAMPDPIPEKSGIANSFRKAGAKKVIVLPGRTVAEVESDEYLEAFREATGIWFGGGRQWRFADAYLDTKVYDLMHDVLKRGGVIMGSSAGASIQGGYLARANPLGNRDIIAEGYERGLGFLPGVAIDQHFAQRKRFKDMTSLVGTYPQLLGIGVDEGTALVVRGQVGEVTGKAKVHFYDRREPVGEGQADYESVAGGGRYDLVKREILDPGHPPVKERKELQQEDAPKP